MSNSYSESIMIGGKGDEIQCLGANILSNREGTQVLLIKYF